MSDARGDAGTAQMGWDGIDTEASGILRLYGEAPSLDLESIERRKACLGTSVTELHFALVLALAGNAGVARGHLAWAHRLALLAHERGETHVYAGTDGQNSFAHYMAMRVARYSGWLLGKEELEVAKYHEALLNYLLSCVAAEPRTTETSVGRLLLHLSEAGDWDRVCIEGRRPVKVGRKLWRTAKLALLDLAERQLRLEAVTRGARLERWFRLELLRKNSEEPLHPDVTLE